MDEDRKSAYRYILYQALLGIRPISDFGWKDILPWRFRSRLRQIRRAGVLADFLHNFAIDAAGDFKNFNEEQFWSSQDHRDPAVIDNDDLDSIRECFEIRLAQLQNPQDDAIQKKGCTFPYRFMR